MFFESHYRHSPDGLSAVAGCFRFDPTQVFRRSMRQFDHSASTLQSLIQRLVLKAKSISGLRPACFRNTKDRNTNRRRGVVQRRTSSHRNTGFQIADASPEVRREWRSEGDPRSTINTASRSRKIHIQRATTSRTIVATAVETDRAGDSYLATDARISTAVATAFAVRDVGPHHSGRRLIDRRSGSTTTS